MRLLEMRNLLDKLGPRKRFSKPFSAFPSFWNVKKYRFKTPYFSKGRIEKGKQKSYNCLIVCKFQPISALLLLLYYYKNKKNNENNRYSLTARPLSTSFHILCTGSPVSPPVLSCFVFFFTINSEITTLSSCFVFFLPPTATTTSRSSVFFSSYQPYQRVLYQAAPYSSLPTSRINIVPSSSVFFSSYH